MPSKMHIQRLILLLAIAAAFSALLPSCRDQPDGASSTPSLPVLSVEGYWDMADELAKEWHNDAQVYNINARVVLPNDKTSGPSIIFAFHSAQDLMTEFIVTCSVESCQSYDLEHSPGYPLHLCPIERNAFRIDTKQVLATALENGLEDYVFEEKATVYLDLSRTVACQEKAVWVASGFISSPLQSTFVWIDAMTGEVIESPY